VTTMSGMFREAVSFKQPLNFNTSSVIYMRQMFYKNNVFNQPLDFDTSNVANMDNMFTDAASFNQNISSWCVSLISEKPIKFDVGSAFAGQTAIQPQWGTCPP